MNQIFCHSSENMSEIPDGSVSLTVTSPPYWNAIDYDIHASDKRQYYRTRQYSNGYNEYSNYLEWLSRILREVLRVTKPGGFLGLVIGTVLFDSRHYPVPFDVVARLVKDGWEFHQDIIWHKCTAGVKRAGVIIQKPYPGYYYPNIMTEYILVFRKPGPLIYKGRAEEQKNDAQVPINRLFTMDIANNIWHIAPVPPNQLDHPCPFPEEIPYRLIIMYSYPGELILDPFLGSGQTTKVAKALNRCYVGYDTIQKYADLSNRRLGEYLSVRPKQLIAVFDKINIDEPISSSEKSNPIESHQKKHTVDSAVQVQLLEKKSKYKKTTPEK